MMRRATHPSTPWRLSLCLLFVAVLALTFVGCDGGDDPEELEGADTTAAADPAETELTTEEDPLGVDETAVAVADLMDQDGNSVGTVEFFDAADGVRVEAELTGLSGDSLHGFHIHENGVCEGDFTSAGGHFNPHDAVHACPPDPRHAGDMGNVQLTAGEATFEYTSSDLSLGDGADSVIGKAVVLHAGQDDCQSQPSGAAGDRLACGLIALAEPMAEDTIEVEPGEETEMVDEGGMDEGDAGN